MCDFITKCLMGEALLEEIDDYIDNWHDSDGDLSVHELLGMTRTEYGLWVEDPSCLPQIVIAHRQHEELTEIRRGHDALPVAARSSRFSAQDNLIKWLMDKGLWE